MTSKKLVSEPLTLRIGKLIDAPISTKKEELERVTQRCANAINEMHDFGG
jgi:1-acyl-sn-glycerol-3-phosphate acyltransferase